MIPFMDLDLQYKSIQEEIDEAIFRVIKNYNFINGPEVALFEKKFAEMQEVKYCVGCSSGTSALHLAYEVVGIRPGDEVIVPTMTFIATAEALRQVGAKPVFIDISPVSYNIDENKIEAAITDKTKAIVAVHLHGNPCEMDRIVEIAKKYNLKLIEDCAQSHISEYKFKKTGTFGDIAAFSFYPGKNLGAYGDAGAVVTNNRRYFENARMLANHGRKEKYYHDVEGYNYRLDTLQAAILLIKMKYLQQWTEQRILNSQLYDKMLKNPDITLPERSQYKKHVYHIYSISTKQREKIITALKENHISYGIHYPLPLHLQPAYRHLGYKDGDFPVAEALSKEFLSLPMYAELTKEQIEFIGNVVKILL
ncbi:MAG: DegT/DnrJ/EryC1/StrS family aminotransferase [Bacteroidia bacterium]|nr:DegT/DnrJ/EryC1/StrS family aminotransferase [Bacteroidia bacterium]